MVCDADSDTFHDIAIIVWLRCDLSDDFTAKASRPLVVSTAISRGDALLFQFIVEFVLQFDAAEADTAFGVLWIRIIVGGCNPVENNRREYGKNEYQ